MFQRQRVDMLLGELLRKFPLPMIPPQHQQAPQQPQQQQQQQQQQSQSTAASSQSQSQQQSQSAINQNGATSTDSEQSPSADGIKQEANDTHHNGKESEDVDMKPPVEKRMKPN